MSLLSIQNLTKNYGNTKALDDVSMQFKSGEIYGLLGRNGAGKSTLINIVTNKIFSCGGSVALDGQSVSENDNVLHNIYSMGEKTGYPYDTRLKNAFKYTMGFYPNFDIDYAYALAKKFDLNLNKKVHQLSTGFNTIYKLILALASNAQVCIYDEPALGLDATVRDVFYKELIKNYTEHPKTIIVSTHLIEEITDMVQNIIVLHEGRVLEDCATEELLQKYYKLMGAAADIDSFCRGKHVADTWQIGGLKTAVVKDNLRQAQREQSDRLKVISMSLQEIFVSITKKEERL